MEWDRASNTAHGQTSMKPYSRCDGDVRLDPLQKIAGLQASGSTRRGLSQHTDMGQCEQALPTRNSILLFHSGDTSSENASEEDSE